jgi:hypothetical protein
MLLIASWIDFELRPAAWCMSVDYCLLVYDNVSVASDRLLFIWYIGLIVW